jgi:dihydrofolate reductase
MSDRKLILFISMSIDGYITTKDDDLSWLNIVEDGDEDYGYKSVNKRVDTYIVGRKTYDVILKLTNGVLPQSESLKCYVITRQRRESENGVTFINEDIESFINKLKSERGKDIYLDGGGEIVKLMMDKNLIDEYIISVIPIFLGDGKRLFKGGIPTTNIKALPSKHYKSGLVQLHYLKQ